MNIIYSEFRNPFRRPSPGEQTKKSIVLRTIAIATGIIGLGIGIYLLVEPGLFSYAKLVGIFVVISTPPLLFLGIFRGQYIHRTLDWALTEDEREALNYVAAHPVWRHRNYVGSELIQAFDALQNDQEFRTAETREGSENFHLPITRDPRAYIESAVANNSIFHHILHDYKTTIRRRPQFKIVINCAKRWYAPTLGRLFIRARAYLEFEHSIQNIRNTFNDLNCAIRTNLDEIQE